MANGLGFLSFLNGAAGGYAQGKINAYQRNLAANQYQAGLAAQQAELQNRVDTATIGANSRQQVAYTNGTTRDNVAQTNQFGHLLPAIQGLPADQQSSVLNALGADTGTDYSQFVPQGGIGNNPMQQAQIAQRQGVATMDGSRANLNNVTAQQLPALDQSRIGLNGARAGLDTVQAQQLPGLDRAKIGLYGAQQFNQQMNGQSITPFRQGLVRNGATVAGADASRAQTAAALEPSQATHYIDEGNAALTAAANGTTNAATNKGKLNLGNREFNYKVQQGGAPGKPSTSGYGAQYDAIQAQKNKLGAQISNLTMMKDPNDPSGKAVIQRPVPPGTPLAAQVDSLTKQYTGYNNKLFSIQQGAQQPKSDPGATPNVHLDGELQSTMTRTPATPTGPTGWSGNKFLVSGRPFSLPPLTQKQPNGSSVVIPHPSSKAEYDAMTDHERTLYAQAVQAGVVK